MGGQPEQHANVDLETQFHAVVRNAADRLWILGAVEETLAALHDVLDEVVSRHEGPTQAPDEYLPEP